jgi:prepilin-type N-terminal cleavage/methylation domain-containing protein
VPSHGREAGFTLVEVLVASLAALVLAGATFSLTLVSSHSEASNANRASKLAELQTGLERMTREIRDATSVAYVAGAGQLAISLPGNVAYDCRASSNTVCRRTVNGTASAVLVEGIANSDVFTVGCRDADGSVIAMTPGAASPAACGTTGAGFVTIRLQAQIDCKGEGDAAPAGQACAQNRVEISGGVDLRNV